MVHAVGQRLDAASVGIVDCAVDNGCSKYTKQFVSGNVGTAAVDIAAFEFDFVSDTGTPDAQRVACHVVFCCGALFAVAAGCGAIQALVAIAFAFARVSIVCAVGRARFGIIGRAGAQAIFCQTVCVAGHCRVVGHFRTELWIGFVE